MGVLDHAEYDGDISILIGGLRNQQIPDDAQPPHWILTKQMFMVDVDIM